MKESIFDKISTEWWDKNGPMKMLHSMNVTRMLFIKERIINKYQKELSSLPKEEFIIFLSKKLQEDKNLTPDKSVIEANAMISKQKCADSTALI